MQELQVREAAPPLMFTETMSILPLETSILPHYTYLNVKKDKTIKLSLLNQMSVLNQLGGYDVWFVACNNASSPNCPPSGPNPCNLIVG